MKCTGTVRTLATAVGLFATLTLSAAAQQAGGAGGDQAQNTGQNQAANQDPSGTANAGQSDNQAAASNTGAAAQSGNAGQETSASGQAPSGAAAAQAQAQAQAAAKPPRQLKIFELKHRSPQEMMQVFSLIRGAHSGQPNYLPGQTTLGFRGTAGADMSVAVNEQRKLLFVRGSQDQIQQIEKLIQALDVEGKQLSKQEFNGVHLIPIPKQGGSQITSTLSQLNLGGQMLHMGDAAFVVFRANDQNKEELQQVEQVISRLSSPAEDQEQGQPSNQQSSGQQNSAAGNQSSGQTDKPATPNPSNGNSGQNQPGQGNTSEGQSG